MWTPANLETLPSENEVACANQAIQELEDLLKSAIEVLEQAKSRIVSLEREIEARRAWLAPIRKVPVEILSEIFVNGSRIDSLMPVTISEVSRLWRKVVLSTPKAWSIIEPVLFNLNSSTISQHLRVFMERSDPYAVHVRMANDDDLEYEYVDHALLHVSASNIRRIKCLCMPAGLVEFMDDTIFPNVTTLSVIYDGCEFGFSSLSHSIFPRLRYLDICNNDYDLPIDEIHLLPLLEYLIIDSNGMDSYFNVIKAFSATLRGLEVRALHQHPPRMAPVIIHLPLLEYLEIKPGSRSSMLFIQAETPALRSYKEAWGTQSTYHRDVKNVTHLRCCYVPQLDPFIALRVLQLPASMPLPELVEQLRHRGDVCPTLKSIELKKSGNPNKEEMDNISLMIKAARPHVEVTFVDSWSELPGSRQEFLCEHANWGSMQPSLD